MHGTSPAAVVLAALIAGSVASAETPPRLADAETAHRAGVEAQRAQDDVAAAEAFRRAVELDPTRIDSWLELGMARSRLKDWDGAISANLRALELDPQNVKGQHNLGNVHFRKGDFAAAAEAYARTLELEPSHMLAAFHLGWTLRQLHRADEAQRAFNRCLEIRPANARQRATRIDCVFGLGSLRHRAGNYEASALMMQEVLAFHPAHPEARYYLGMAYRQLGRLAEAREQLEIHAKILDARREAMDAAGQRRP